MCDCYGQACEGECGRGISLHIADFCTKRENVHAYCPWCVRAGKIRRRGTRTNPYWKKRWPDKPNLYRHPVIKGGKCAQVFVEVVESNCQIDDGKRAVGRKGQIVVILCDDPRAYGIHLN